jgi:cation diffusion facilitator CzcD-associated flavoprotein CzcO
MRTTFPTHGHGTQVSVLVLGAGPTGLGTATRLQQHGFEDWLIVDKV